MEIFDPDDKGKKELAYRIKTASEKEIRAHFKKCNNDFLPPLNERVNIDEYAKKIFEKSVTFETWSGYFLVGLVAAYFNDQEHQTGYISNVSLAKNYVGMGIASELMKQCIRYAKRHKFKVIKLEVHNDNDPATRLYKKFGFMNFGKKGNFALMKLTSL